MKHVQKIVIVVLISLIAAGAMVSCQRNQPSASGTPAASAAVDTGPFPGKIAIVTNTVSQNEEEFRSAEALVRKYGANKVVHVTWPDNFMAEQEQMVTTLSRLAADRDIKAVIINQAVPGSNPAVDKLLETRDDVYIVYCSPQENAPDVSRRANLIFNTDEIGQGPAMVRQAKAQGAKVFVHYSFPRHMSIPLLSARRDLIRQTCAEEGIQFVDATAPDPTSDVGLTGAQQFIREDVPRMIARYGVDTAFYSTNCGMQIPLIEGVVAGRAIYPQPCCPSPFHGFPSALGIPTDADINATINQTKAIAAANGMTGRLSTYPVPAAMMYTTAGAEYAIKYLNGEVPFRGINERVLAELMSIYARETTGANVQMAMTNYTESGQTFDNFKMILMDYLTY